MGGNFDYAFRALALVNILVLLLLWIVINGARERWERVERKLDALMVYMGLGDEVQAIDDESGRKSAHAPLQ